MAAPETTQDLAPRGFPGLICPRCGEAGADISIDLNDLTGDEAIQCRECEEAFSLQSIRDVMACWAPVLAWVELAPKLEDQP